MLKHLPARKKVVWRGSARHSPHLANQAVNFAEVASITTIFGSVATDEQAWFSHRTRGQWAFGHANEALLASRISDQNDHFIGVFKVQVTTLPATTAISPAAHRADDLPVLASMAVTSWVP